jgi:hypothetical protein
MVILSVAKNPAYFQTVEILHSAQDDRKTTFARGSNAFGPLDGTGGRKIIGIFT